MGVYDFLTLQNMKEGWTKLLNGSYSVSLGDNLSAFIGSGRQTHIVGDEIKYVVDWVRCLEQVPYLGSLLKVLPLNALLGEGGNMTWTFGRKTDLHYIGPAIAINRAGKKAVTSKVNFFSPDPKPKDYKGTADEWEAKEKVAKFTGVITALLSAAMVAVNTGVQIAARVKYQDKYKPSSGTPDKDAVVGMTEYCTISLIMTTRMMYLIKSLELITVMAQNAVTDFYTAFKNVSSTTTAAICASVTLAVFEDITKRLSKAKEAATEFLEDMAALLLALVFIALMVLLGLRIAGVL